MHEAHYVGITPSIARPQPEARHHLGFGNDPNEWMVGPLLSARGVTGSHPFLLVSILVQQLGAIYIQRVAVSAAAQPLQTPTPEPAKALAVSWRAFKTLEKTTIG